MIKRNKLQIILEYLQQFPAVALLGPRQVGKTTLAFQLAEELGGIYLDLESPSDQAKFEDVENYLKIHQNRLVILDEVQRMPGLFQILRVVIDKAKRQGKTAGQFLLLGSASIDLLQQSGESLAGRIAFVELSPLNILETTASNLDKLWLRGGFPDSFLAKTETMSFRWREQFIRTYLERDIPELGLRIPASRMRRFWTMLAHHHGQLLNQAQLARALEVDGKTIGRYLDLLVDLLLVYRLQPWHSNTGKRMVKSPKYFLRDAGILHTLLGINNHESLLGHPIAGMSWEGFVLENIVSLLPEGCQLYFYRTATGVEIDLLLCFNNGKKWVVEIKRSTSAKLQKGFHLACENLKPDRKILIYGGEESFRQSGGIEVIGLKTFLEKELNLANR